jgi:serine/threonine protein kinase
MAPLSRQVALELRRVRLAAITCGGHSVADMAEAQRAAEEEGARGAPPWLAPVAVTLVFVAVISGGAGGYVLHRYLSVSRVLAQDGWEVRVEDLLFYITRAEAGGGRMRLVASWPSVESLTEVSECEDGYSMLEHILHWPAKLHGHTVGLRLLEVLTTPPRLSRDLKLVLLGFQGLRHDNVLRFHGLCELQGHSYVVSDFCSRGALYHVLQEERDRFNKDFKFSLCVDVASGLRFLHQKGIIHGQLSSLCCLLDAKWSVKLADWEYIKIFSKLSTQPPPHRHTPDAIGHNEAAFHELWAAPELVRGRGEWGRDEWGRDEWGRGGGSGRGVRGVYPSMASDTYSLAVILNEILTCAAPYSEHRDTLTEQDILKAVLANNLRPAHWQFSPTDVSLLLDKCWSPEPQHRPNTDAVIKTLHAAYR